MVDVADAGSDVQVSRPAGSGGVGDKYRTQSNDENNTSSEQHETTSLSAGNEHHDRHRVTNGGTAGDSATANGDSNTRDRARSKGSVFNMYRDRRRSRNNKVLPSEGGSATDNVADALVPPGQQLSTMLPGVDGVGGGGGGLIASETERP